MAQKRGQSRRFLADYLRSMAERYEAEEAGSAAGVPVEAMESRRVVQLWLGRPGMPGSTLLLEEGNLSPEEAGLLSKTLHQLTRTLRDTVIASVDHSLVGREPGPFQGEPGSGGEVAA